MASDELRSITIDKWDDEVWGIVSEPHRVHLSTSPSSSSQQPVSNTNSGKAVIAQPPKTIFYFGKSDHWVAEKTREDIIRSRGSIKGTTTTGNGNGDVISRKRPKMVICEEGLPHAFCLSELCSLSFFLAYLVYSFCELSFPPSPIQALLTIYRAQYKHGEENGRFCKRDSAGVGVILRLYVFNDL
jgi:hypothetical protein